MKKETLSEEDRTAPSMQKKEIHLKGLGLSSGCAIGRVCLFNDGRHSDLPRYQIDSKRVRKEQVRIATACRIAKKRLDKLIKEVAEKIGDAESKIFAVQKMILCDETLIAEVNGYIADKQRNAEAAVEDVLTAHHKKLAEMDDDYIRARATDIRELKERLLDVLRNRKPSLKPDAEKDSKIRNRIVVTRELSPALIVELDHELTIGFVTVTGGVHSHAAILARSKGIPAVGNLHDIEAQVSQGTKLLVNGETGEVVIHPSKRTVKQAVARYPVDQGTPEAVDPVADLKVLANINDPSDLEVALKMQAEGVGLYRTEFELLTAGRMLTEDELYKRYLSVRQRTEPDRKVVYRMFDVGKEKHLPFMNIPYERNPSLGWCGSRLLLDREELFETQARALARVSLRGAIHVMYPMIVDLNQFLEMRKRFNQYTSDIKKGDIKHGIMFEVPSACLQAGELFTQIDFGSIGTNDLFQYVFAIDRENENITQDYILDHPVFRNLIRHIADHAEHHSKPLSICGELDGEPSFTKKLISLGIHEVSVNARRIPVIRKAAAKDCQLHA